MDAIIYVAIFLTGIVFGSFFTLAVYRIPRKENIVYGRSHCTSCNHKLGFWDLIPILSYIFLGGKCRYCGEKIRIRYLLLEIFSGFVFLAIALTHGIENIVNLCFIYLFIAGMFIIAGIDKEKYEIPNGLCIYELFVAIFHLLYSYYTKSFDYRYTVYALIVPLIFYILDKLFSVLYKDENKVPIGYGDIKYLALIGLMFGFPIQITSIVISTFVTLVGILIHRYKEIPWGYYLTIATIMVLIIEPYIANTLNFIII
ncbi:MAG: prepilin peptidase [Clostridia bacterium]|nr:prepilin peptidase [Clostridia bacterium]